MTDDLSDPRPLDPGAGTDDDAAETVSLGRTSADLARFVHPQLALDLRSSGRVSYGVRSLSATILFVDMRDFSELVEALAPPAALRLLEEFLTLMIACVHRNGGTVDKLLGDGLMATFGIPTPSPDDADRAVECAAGMVRKIAAWNHCKPLVSHPDVRIGIGIDTGTVLAGPIGAPARMDYTVIGGAVNIAAKLQQAGSGDGAPVLVSARTCGQFVRKHELGDAEMVGIGRRGRQVAVHRLQVALPGDGRDHVRIAAQSNCAMQHW